MTDLAALTSEHEVHLNSARINLQGCLRMVEELLRNKPISPDAIAARIAEINSIISQCNWAITYLYSAQAECKP